MNTDDFEKQLQRQPLQTPPAAWRGEILAAARAAHPDLRSVQATGWLPLLWRELVAPCRLAWCGLAVVWLAMAAINFGLRDGPTQTASALPSREMQMAMQEQQTLMAELIGPPTPLRATPAKPKPSQPRSDRQSRLRFA